MNENSQTPNANVAEKSEAKVQPQVDTNDRGSAESLAVSPSNSTRVTARKAESSAGQVVVSSSPLPSIDEMKWLKDNCPNFLEAFQKDLLEESQHRRNLEVRGSNTGRYLGTLAIGLMFFTVAYSNPYAATGLGVIAAVFYAASVFMVSARTDNLPNIKAEGRRQSEEKIEQETTNQ